jgi:hypothetical protein
VAGSCECGDEPSGSGATELVGWLACLSVGRSVGRSVCRSGIYVSPSL